MTATGLRCETLSYHSLLISSGVVVGVPLLCSLRVPLRLHGDLRFPRRFFFLLVLGNTSASSSACTTTRRSPSHSRCWERVHVGVISHSREALSSRPLFRFFLFFFCWELNSWSCGISWSGWDLPLRPSISSSVPPAAAHPSNISDSPSLSPAFIPSFRPSVLSPVLPVALPSAVAVLFK